MNWLTSLFGTSSPKSLRSTRKPARRKQRSLRFEQCETRQLMTGNPLVMAPALTTEVPPALIAPAVPAAPAAPVFTTAAQSFAAAPTTMGPFIVASNPSTPVLHAPLATSPSLNTAAEAGKATTQKAATAKIDLDISVVSTAVTPTQAKDLNLQHFFGGEKVTVPTVVRNYGPDTASGSATVSVYLSTTKNLNGSPVLLGQKTVNINLGNNAKQTVSLDVTIPKTLVERIDYFIVAKVTTPLKQSTINDVRSSDRTFEFLGTPTHLAAFTPNAQGKILYFEVVRDTLAGRLALKEQNILARMNDPQSFISSFQTDAPYPYLSGGVPMIGLGINLNTLDSYMEHVVATYVRGYYKSAYGQTLSGSDTSIINMLKTQAYTGSTKQAFTARQDQSLFNLDYQRRMAVGEAALGKTIWSRIAPMPRIALMDMIYATGGIQANMIDPLKSLDYVQAGFRLLDSPRATQSAFATLRVKAEYQNLLDFTKTWLGQII
ncbi:MAG: hypothetical protein AB7U73_03185 [Pirellulales bacterium]